MPEHDTLTKTALDAFEFGRIAAEIQAAVTLLRSASDGFLAERAALGSENYSASAGATFDHLEKAIQWAMTGADVAALLGEETMKAYREASER